MATLSSDLKPTDFLDRKQAAEYLGVKFNTLTSWVSQKKGPPFYKTGKAVRYKVEDLNAFLEKYRVEFEQVTI